MRLNAHRNLYNADCSTIFYNPEIWQPEGGRYSAKAVNRFVDTIAGAGVDTLLINPNAQIAWFPSKAIPTNLDGYKRGDREFVRGHLGNNPDPGIDEKKALDAMCAMQDLYLDLAETGVDWVAEMIAACRRRGVSAWSSVRMNDTHGSASPEDSYHNCPLFKDPKYRLSGACPNPKDKPFVWFIGMNYEFAEVREFTMTLIRELVRDYDFEGMELDWTRHLPIFGMPASRENVETITRFTADVRALTQAKASRAGKRYPLGVRVPADLSKTLSFGIDVREMAHSGLIDFVVAGNFWTAAWDAPIDRLRCELGDDVTVYGCTETIANWLTIPSSKHPDVRCQRSLGWNPPLLRGNAAGQLALGADGIEQFNFFCADAESKGISDSNHPLEAAAIRADYSALRGIADLETLRGKPKQYTLASKPTDWWMPPHIERPEQLPAVIEPGARRAFTLAMASEPLDRGLRLIAQIVVDRQERAADLGVSLNGAWPTFAGAPTEKLLFGAAPFDRHDAGQQAFDFQLNVADIRHGWNEIVVCCGTHAGASPRSDAVRVVSIELAIQD